MGYIPREGGREGFGYCVLKEEHIYVGTVCGNTGRLC